VLINNALLKRISTVANGQSAFHRYAGHPTTKLPCVFGLAREKGGLQTQYRVVIVPEELLRALARYPIDILSNLQVPPYLSFRLETLKVMARQFQQEGLDAKQPKLLGRISVCIAQASS